MTASKCPALWRRLIAAATLAAGFGGLWFVLVNLLGDLWLRPGPAGALREEIVVREDGTPLMIRMPRGGARGTLYDLDGSNAIDSQGVELIEGGWLNTLARWSYFDLHIFLFESDFPAQWEHRLRLFGLAAEYENLVYACRRCNQVKSDATVADPFLVMCRDRIVTGDDGSVRGVDAEATRLILALELNSPRLVEWRVTWMRIIDLAAERDAIFPRNGAMSSRRSMKWSWSVAMRVFG
ncbi:MAG TPA: hypothetical protein VFW87_18570 [Pirellulales bacterium]|nr:hypothetical protein [Pirellulales bacterium]